MQTLLLHPSTTAGCTEGDRGDEEPARGGDADLQENLVSIIRLQIGGEKVKEFVSEKSEELIKTAEEAKEEVDQLARLTMDRSNLAFDCALADINQTAEEFAEQLRRSREKMEADAKEFSAWEDQVAVRRSRGQFFQSLYQTDKKKPVGSRMDKDQARIEQVANSAGEGASTLRLFIFSFLAVSLSLVALVDFVSTEPSVAQDIFYLVLALGLGGAAVLEQITKSARSDR
ncbi:hypothetical protein WJX72_006178 [[Myrmecia] bisecta]|uniref:Transmembrane protein n=1 Tax=[Myrmecia] bisecta TaxID=41462 RepID=A0AAW1PDQ5_9CHLO